MPDSTHDFARISSTAASSGDLIDDFEDANVDEYSGDTGPVSIQTGTVYNRSYALDTAADGNFIYSTSGLPNYPAQGDIWETYAYITSTQSETVLDDFEDGDVSEWDSNITAQTGTVYEGTYAGEVDDGGSSIQTFSPADPTPDELLVWARGSSDQDYRPNVQWEDGQGDNSVVIGGHSDGEFRTRENGGWVTTGITGYSPGNWYLFRGYDIDWANQTHSIEVLDGSKNSLGTYTGSPFDANADDLGRVTVIGSGTAGEYMYYDKFLYRGSAVPDFGYHAFGVQDGSNYYEYEIDPDGGSLAFYVVSGGSRSSLGSVSGLTIPTGEWLRTEFTWQTDGTMKGELFKTSDGSSVGSVEVTDGTYTSGGVGWKE